MSKWFDVRRGGRAMKRNLAKKSADQKKTRGTSHVKEIEAE